LRDATAAAHEEVDQIFSAFDLGDGTEYRHFLLAQAAAFLPIEAALDSAGADTLIDDWRARRRAALLREDLEALGLAAPDPVPPPALHSREEMLGAIYVLEGSRLGGALLSRAVDPKAPMAFLGTKGDSARWRKLLDDLELSLYRNDQIAAAAGAANRVFQCFALAGQRQLECLRL
jgi:heme oxygenase